MEHSLLDSSLILATLYRTQSNLFHDIKVIDCGSYIQIYRLSLFKKTPQNIDKFSSLIENIDTDFLDNLHSALDSSDNSTPRNVSMQLLVDKKNIQRSKLQCQRLAKCNSEEWKSFITLTFKENIQDVVIANKYFRNYINEISRSFKDFKYIAIPEFQSRGAIHYHILTNLECGCKFIPLQNSKKLWNPVTKRYKIFDYYNLKYWKHGFSQAQSVSGDIKKVVGYISKYMTKDIDSRLFGKHRYFFSRNLKRPVVSYLSSFDSDHMEFLSKLIGEDKAIYCNTYNNSYSGENIIFEEYYH